MLRWLEVLRVDSMLVENVPEFMDWGPLDRQGHPVKSRKGEVYRAWLTAIKAFGYNVDTRILNAADFGAATSRSRFFLLAKKGNKPIQWPEPTRSKKGTGRRRWRAAREIIDWDLKGESIFTRKKPLSPKTIERIAEGLRRFGGAELASFLVTMEHGGGVRNLDLPLNTITTARGGSMALVQPFVLSQASGGAPRSVGDPLPTIVHRGGGMLVQPFLLSQGSNGSPKSTDEPVPAIMTAGKIAFVVPHFGERADQAPRTHSVDEPLPAITSHGAGSLVQFILPVRGFFGQNTAKSIEDPLGTVTQRGGGNLVEYLVQYNGASKAQSVDEPLGTVTTQDHFALVQSTADFDIRFRMLQPHELAAATGFPKGYVFKGTKTDTVKQIGNAVVVDVARALAESLLTRPREGLAA